jgi:sodium-dependent dicarboxylate transporter 2/3/5
MTNRVLFIPLFLIVGFVVYLLSPAELGHQARALMGLLLSTVLFWLFEVAPLGVVALGSAALAVLIGIADAKTVFKNFAHPLIFLFLGSFLIAAAFSKYGIDRYIAVKVLKNPAVKRSETLFITAVLFIPWFLSMWLSNTATTAMLLPIVAGLLAVLYPGGEWAQNRLKFLLLAIAYASSIGGIATPVGTPPNIIAMGFLQKAGVEITFGEWMLKALPVSVVFFILLVAFTKYLVGTVGVERIKTDTLEEPKLQFAHKVVLAVFGAVVFLWLLPSLLNVLKEITPAFGGIAKVLKHHLNAGAVAVLGAVALFLIPKDPSKPSETILTVRDLKKIDWDTILLFGGGLALGSLMFKTGLVHYFGKKLAAAMPHSEFWVIFILTAVAIFLTEFSSNTATANVLVPVVIGLSHTLGVDVFKAVFATTLACSFAFMLPMATPPNAIVFGFTRMRVYEMARVGLVLNLLGILVITLLVYFGL